MSALDIGNMLKLEVNKKYRTRDGRVATIGDKPPKHGNKTYPFAGTIEDREHSWTPEGRCTVADESAYDLIEEIVVEPKFVFKVGQKYKCRNGDVVEVSKIKESGYPIRMTDGSSRSIKGTYFEHAEETVFDLMELVEAQEEKPKLTLPLVLGRKYVMGDGRITQATKERDGGPQSQVQLWCHEQVHGIWHYTNTGNNNIGSMSPKYKVVADYVEEYQVESCETEIKVEFKPAKNNKQPVKYTGLTFVQAWNLARDTKKPFRLAGHNWQTLAKVRLNKEMFMQHQWEVEK